MGESDWTRIGDHLRALVGLEPGEREAYIARVAAGDERLVEELRSLLPYAEQASGPLDGAASELAFSAPFDLVGKTVGSYRIIERIGIGGMGVVYRASRSDQNFELDVAVKFLSPGGLDEEGQRRFQRERQILARLDHPHIARLLDAGSLEGCGPYVVMELVSGRPIDLYVEQEKPSLPEVLRLFGKVCQAVQAAHQQLVVHRDIKPSNVLVDEEGQPKLLDFGIAKLIDDSSARDGQQTITRLMTPRYAAPEQLEGQTITVATDVYALGVLLYKLLTGSSPYAVDLDNVARLHEAILEGRIRPASRAARQAGRSAAWVRSLEGEIDNILAMALARDPRQRYGSAVEMAADLDAYLEGLPIRARPATASYRLRKFVRRHRAAVVAAVVVVVALIAGSISTAVQARAAVRARNQAEQRYEEVRELTEALIFEVNDELAKIPGTTAVRQGLVARALAYLEKLRDEVAGNEDLAASVAGAYLRVGDLQGHPSLDNLGDRAGAQRSYTAGMELCRDTGVTPRSAPELRYACAVLPMRVALIDYFIGDLDEGARLIASHREGLEALSAEYPDRPEYLIEYSDALRLLAQIYSWQDESKAAIATFEEVIGVYQEARRRHPEVSGLTRGLASALSGLGAELVYVDRVDEGLGYLRRAVAEEAGRAAAHPEDADAQRSYWFAVANLTIELIQAGRPAEAVDPGERSLALAEALYRRDPASHRSQKDLAMARRYLGKALVGAGEPDRGRKYLEQVLEWWQSQHDVAPTTNTQRNLALVGLDLGDGLRALASHEGGAELEPAACGMFAEALERLEQLDADGNLEAVDRDWVTILGERLEGCSRQRRR